MDQRKNRIVDYRIGAGASGRSLCRRATRLLIDFLKQVEPQLNAQLLKCYLREISGMSTSLMFTPTSIAGAFLIDPILRHDGRGHFSRAWCTSEFSEQGLNFVPVQANTGFSFKKGTLRGLHFQVEPALEAKLVRCTRGVLFDVVADLRPNSPSYCKWYGVELKADQYQMLYVPEGCAHGYQTLEDNTDLFYMTSQYFTPSAARGMRYDDPAFGIKWPLVPTMISEQDRNWPLFDETSPS